MSSSLHSAEPADWPALLPNVQLEVRQGDARTASYPLDQVDFLIGSVPGCDLRVGGAEPSAVLCLLARHPAGVTLRKLALTQAVLVNGQSVTHAELADGDRVQVGLLDLRIHVEPAKHAVGATLSADIEQARRELNEHLTRFREQVLSHNQEKEALERARQEVLHQQNARDAWPSERADLLRQIEDRDRRLAAPENQDLQKKRKEYEADVVRLDRWQGALEQRDRALKQLADELAQRQEQLKNDSAELETQVLQIDEWRAKLTDEADRLAVQQREQAERARNLHERTAILEGQQASLSVLRSRLERMREEIRSQQQQVDEQRVWQDDHESERSQKAQELKVLELDLENQRRQYEQDRKQWLERGAIIETAVRQMKQAQENLAIEDERVRRVAQELEARERQIQENDGILQGRLTQLAEAQERIDLERNALRERSVNLLQREQACESLQEQLRRRSDEIARRHLDASEQLTLHEKKIAAYQEQQQQIEAERQASAQKLQAWQQELEQKAAELQAQQAEVNGFAEKYHGHLDHLSGQRKMLVQEQSHLHQEHQESLERLAAKQAEFENLRREAQELSAGLPDVELRAGTAIERLGQARAQMRDHLTEIHRYVRECQEEVASVRSRLKADVENLQQQEQLLRQAQDEHRLAMVGHRQHLIDWQGQIADLKRLLSRDETRLERKQAAVDERAREMEAESERMAKQAEDLDQQEREVADRRLEIDSHLTDMREWYRRKLRQLAGIPVTSDAIAAAAFQAPADTSTADGEEGLTRTGRSILSITSSVDAGDQKLGQVLREAQLVDADTLMALLAEARRQRRTLRQVLLASGVITLYQLALIETGNTSGLMIGPVRLIDRLRNAAHETVYRVFDPRRGTEAVLRHLAESDMTDATRPDEFRQRFSQAMLNDPHLANTLEVLELSGRPAALQEWLAGLPATDWPPLTAAPGVCYRLLTQAAHGLVAAHTAGVVHGHLADASLLLTGDGILKITGLGEPPWLIGLTLEEEPTPRDDLRALGKIVSGWCTPTGVRKGAKTKPLPEALISVLYRLAADGDAGYRDGRELLQDLEKAASEIPANSEAWDRLLKYVREHGADEALLRQSA